MTLEFWLILALLTLPIYLLHGFSIYNQSKLFKLYINALLSKTAREFTDTGIIEKSLTEKKKAEPGMFRPLEGLSDEEFFTAIKD